MISVHKAISTEKDSASAGRRLGEDMRRGFDGAAPDAIVVFASADHDYQQMLSALCDASGCPLVVGSSSAGEFTNESRSTGSISAMALRSTDMRFAIGLGREISVDPAGAAAQVVRHFQGLSGSALPYRAALVLTDALAGHTDALVEELTLATGGTYRFFGGGAGDDGRFQKTHVFAGREAVTNAVVALEILSEKPVGVGVSHGWEPSGEGLRVTEARGMTIVSLNGRPAVEAFADFADASGQRFDRRDPMPFFLHNVLGIRNGEGYRLRVPLAINDDGSVACAAPVPEGAIVHVMKTTARSAVAAARNAAQSALHALDGHKPGAAFVFDCVATRLRMGEAFDDELAACANVLGSTGFIGCNTYGQIARAEGQFGGFHNCTAVACVLPD
jgi:hypothetical protein